MPQQHRLTAAPNVARSPVPTATRATAGPMHGPGPGPASPRGGGGCHLVPLLSAGDVQLAMQALQSAAWIQDYVWNSADPATAASPRTTSGGGGGISSRREALAAVAAPVYREALAAASQIQHPALHSLVNQAVAYYVDPALGEPEDVLRVILELLTACGGTPAATAAPQPPLQQLHPPAARDARVPSNSSAVRHKQAQPASANSAAAAGSRRSESGTSRLSVVTAPQHRSMDDTRRTSSSCRASPVAAESAASRGCGALGSGASGLSKHGGVSGTRVAGVEASLPAGAEARGSGSGSGFKGFGLRQVAQRFLFRSDGSSTSGTGSATSEAALSVGSSLGSLGLCTNGSAATAGVDAAARLSSTGSGVAAPHSGGEGVPSAGPNSNGLLAGPDAAMQAYLVMTDASYTASAPTSLTTAGATSPAAVTAAAMFALGGSAGAEGSGSGRRAAALLQEGLERVPVPRGGSGSGDATGVSSGASRALRALSLHGLRDLVFRSHHSSPARGTAGQRSSTGGGMDSSTRLEAGAAVPPHALVVLDGGGGTAPEDTRCRQQQQQQQQHRHHRHHLKGLLGLFKKAATATH
ncbi:hypothetical protein HYH02_003615 [Chlamydomonas schloesseri]|uniref:Uncharacterized protein n=1 Tax=Chlamydomonas schloesseri TaxID=2026947 RepID=A0A836BA71_9CHLO|nr:hypothetical protein HYH02_003615 [Chlamydomonas schloesseri]|eukprot:KAG2451839.1 hypothetical protein HYH02_003615 [Chlamydomonas schloesseri]